VRGAWELEISVPFKGTGGDYRKRSTGKLRRKK